MNDTRPHGAPSTIPLVRPVKLELYTDKMSLNDRLEAGDIAGVIGSALPKSVKTDPNIRAAVPGLSHARDRLLPASTKIFPIMHLVVLARDFYEKHPFVATSLFNACCDAKAIALPEDARARHAALHAAVDGGGDGGDRRGVRRRSLAVRHRRQPAVARGAWCNISPTRRLIEKPVPVESLFVPIYGQASKP